MSSGQAGQYPGPSGEREHVQGWNGKHLQDHSSQEEFCWRNLCQQRCPKPPQLISSVCKIALNIFPLRGNGIFGQVIIFASLHLASNKQRACIVSMCRHCHTLWSMVMFNMNIFAILNLILLFLEANCRGRE